MSHEFDFLSPAPGGAGVRRQGAVRGVAYLIFAAVVLLNVAYSYLADISFDLASLLRFSTDCFVYLLSVYIVFLCVAEAGRQDGYTKGAFTEAAAAYAEIRRQVIPHMPKLDAFCAAYVRADLAARQKECLLACGLEVEALDACRKLRRLPATLTPRQKRALRRAKNIRPSRLTRERLLYEGGGAVRADPLEPPGRKMVRRSLRALLPTTLCSVFAVQVVFAAKLDPDPRAILLQCLLRVIVLAWSALRGYAAGHQSVTEDTAQFLCRRTELLDQFLRQLASGLS
ncbi:MAG: hypothetical protein WDA00_06440 [Eubacteriales bacterium]